MLCLGFGFSAGGLLFPYFVGVINTLHQLRIIEPGVQLAGASAGSLICACYNAGLPPSEILTLFYELSNDLKQGGTYRRLGPCLEKLLDKHLPDDAHLRCSGNTFIAITAALPYARGQIISEFESKADLVQCLLTSCHIPMYFTGSMARTFRGRICYDGGVTNFIPTPPSSYATRVCCFPSQGMPSVANIHIAPDTFDDAWSAVPFSTMVRWALAPADDDVLLKLTARGERDAASWAHLTGVLHAACPDPDDWYRHAFLDNLSLLGVSRDVAGVPAVPATRENKDVQEDLIL